MLEYGRDSKMLVLAKLRISNRDTIKFNGRQINIKSHSHNYSRKNRKCDSKFEAIANPQAESQVYKPLICRH